MEKANKTMSQTLKVLGNGIRLDILGYLRNGGSCVCDIYDHLRLPQNLVSHHLAVLRENDFIKARKDGKWVYYSLNPTRFKAIEDFIHIFSATKKTKAKSKCIK